MRCFTVVAALAGLGPRPARCDECAPFLTGVIDGPLPGGTPKAVELYFPCQVPNASGYSVGTDDPESERTSLSGCVSGGAFVYVATEETHFKEWFNLRPDFVGQGARVDGDDAVQLFHNGVAISTFGEVGKTGTNTLWEYLDGWAYRKSSSDPHAANFDVLNWAFSGKNALDGDASNSASFNKFPAASFVFAPVDDSRAGKCMEVVAPAKPRTAADQEGSEDAQNAKKKSEEEPISKMYIVVIIALAIAMILALWTLASRCRKSLRRRMGMSTSDSEGETPATSFSVLGRATPQEQVNLPTADGNIANSAEPDDEVTRAGCTDVKMNIV